MHENVLQYMQDIKGWSWHKYLWISWGFLFKNTSTTSVVRAVLFLNSSKFSERNKQKMSRSDMTVHHVCNCYYIVNFTKPDVVMADDCLSTSHTWELLGLPLAHSWGQILLTYPPAIITTIGQYPRYRFLHKFDCLLPLK